MKKGALAIVPAAAPAQDRGPLIDAKQIAKKYYSDRFSVRWVTQHVAPEARRKIGRNYLWRELDVQEWLNSQ